MSNGRILFEGPSELDGARTTCADCGLCAGASAGFTKSVTIAAHGGFAVMAAVKARVAA